MTPEEIERAAMVMPLMILGVALGMRVFRAIDPLQLSAEQVGETVTGMLLQGVGAGSGPGVAINPSALRP